MPTPDLVKKITAKLKRKNLNINNEEKIYKMIEYAKQRTNTINEIIHEIMKFADHVPVDKEILDKYDYQNLGKLWSEELRKNKIINENLIKNIIALSKKTLNIAGKNLFIPLRLMLIGEEHGPDLHTIIDILGQEESIRRIENIKID